MFLVPSVRLAVELGVRLLRGGELQRQGSQQRTFRDVRRQHREQQRHGHESDESEDEAAGENDESEKTSCTENRRRTSRTIRR